ncbi:MAG: hypothetical protein ACJAZ8_002646 [Planctomycetota bacterium]|jgi:hypothetical protein
MKNTASNRMVLAAAGLLFATTVSSCRDSNSQGSASLVAFVPSLAGTDGCNGVDQVFTPGQAFAPVALGTWTGDAMSQVAGARGEERLFLTGAGATVVEVDLTGGGLVETALVTAGVVQSLLDPLLSGPAPVLSGLCVLDSDTLLVMEHSFNVVLMISRSVPDTVTLFAGLPSAVPGLADGPASLSRFSFDAAASIVATGDGTVLVADSGNHAIRAMQSGFVTTLAGSGAPFFGDGDLAATFFDTPSGLSITCAGRLLVSELGLGMAGGHRIRSLALGQLSFFGQAGTVTTLVGDGTPISVQGAGEMASVAGPMSPVTTADGEIYWIDGDTGVLRRWSPADGTVDCPLWTDCASVLIGSERFTPMGLTSLVSSDGGVLYALDAVAGTLVRITP